MIHRTFSCFLLNGGTAQLKENHDKELTETHDDF